MVTSTRQYAREPNLPRSAVTAYIARVLPLPAPENYKSTWWSYRLIIVRDFFRKSSTMRYVLNCEMLISLIRFMFRDKSSLDAFKSNCLTMFTLYIDFPDVCPIISWSECDWWALFDPETFVYKLEYFPNSDYTLLDWQFGAHVCASSSSSFMLSVLQYHWGRYSF